MVEKLLELKNVSKSFSLGGQRRNYALNRINLSVYRGETLGVLGESGCGKSTLARVIMGVYRPTEGSILFQDRDLKLRSQKERKTFAKHAQMIFQDPYTALDPHMTVNAIVAESLLVHEKLNKRERDLRVGELLAMTGLPWEYGQRFPHEFSGGQRQRIGIARALAARPDFIVCDEPMSALDTSIQSQIMRLLTQLKEDLHLTYLFITHDLHMARCLSDRIAVMYAGRIVEIGNAEDVYTNPNHPYTQMLLRSVLLPEPNKTRLEQESGVRGEAIALSDDLRGCPFAERCPAVEGQCRRDIPELSEWFPSHQTACFAVGK